MVKSQYFVGSGLQVSCNPDRMANTGGGMARALCGGRNAVRLGNRTLAVPGAAPTKHYAGKWPMRVLSKMLSPDVMCGMIMGVAG